MTGGEARSQNRDLALVVLAVAFTAIHLLRTLYAPETAATPVDFAGFWDAGRVWLGGDVPYGPDVPSYLEAPFAAKTFFYPPAIRPLFELFARLPLPAATNAFAAFSVAAWAGACWIVTRRCPSVATQPVRFAALFTVTGLLAVPLRLSIECGQTITLITLALAALPTGPNARSQWARVGTILFVLSLKPQFGLPLALAALVRCGSWRAIALAAALVVAATLYGCNFDPLTVIPQFLGNVAAYDTFPENAPETTSGLPILADAMGIAPPALLPLAVAMIAAVLWARTGLTSERVYFLATVSTLLILPSHGYDYLVLVAVAPALLDAPRATMATIGGGTLLLGQSAILASLGATRFIGGYFTVALIDTAAILLIAVASAFWLIDWPSRGLNRQLTVPG